MFSSFSGAQVAYDDGDVEVLLLRDEKWEFISEVCTFLLMIIL
jgi:hypothetical protein